MVFMSGFVVGRGLAFGGMAGSAAGTMEGRRRKRRDANSSVSVIISRDVLGIPGRLRSFDVGGDAILALRVRSTNPPNRVHRLSRNRRAGGHTKVRRSVEVGRKKRSAVVVVSSFVEVVVAGNGDTYLGRGCRGCRRSSVVGVGRMFSMSKERVASQGEHVFLGVVCCRSLASHGANKSTMRRPGNRAHAPGPTVATKSFNSKLGSGPHSSSISSTRDEGILFLFFFSCQTPLLQAFSFFVFRKAES